MTKIGKQRFLMPLLLASLPLTLLGYVLTPLPVVDTITPYYPPDFVIDSEDNPLHRQGHNQCVGFAIAYLLRHVDAEACGKDVYDNLSFKVPFNGYVTPRGLFDYLKQSGLNPQVWVGDLDTLKTRLALGNPVLVSFHEGLWWHHCVILLGYNTHLRQMYLYDPSQPLFGTEHHPRNRLLTEACFERLWTNNFPFYNRYYVTIDP